MPRDANDILREDGEAILRERIDGMRQAGGRGQETDPGECDAGDDTHAVPPRQWLLGNVFCRRFVSSLIADGGTGKTALRVAQALALATGRNLTGE